MCSLTVARQLLSARRRHCGVLLTRCLPDILQLVLTLKRDAWRFFAWLGRALQSRCEWVRCLIEVTVVRKTWSVGGEACVPPSLRTITTRAEAATTIRRGLTKASRTAYSLNLSRVTQNSTHPWCVTKSLGAATVRKGFVLVRSRYWPMTVYLLCLCPCALTLFVMVGEEDVFFSVVRPSGFGTAPRSGELSPLSCGQFFCSGDVCLNVKVMKFQHAWVNGALKVVQCIAI